LVSRLMMMAASHAAKPPRVAISAASFLTTAPPLLLEGCESEPGARRTPGARPTRACGGPRLGCSHSGESGPVAPCFPRVAGKSQPGL
jgi:hypothetical protein